MIIESPFSNHEIVHSHVDPAAFFGTWLCKRPDAGANADGYTNVYWFRVVADRGVLTVTGDFYPTTFVLGPRNQESCVRWIGDLEATCRYFLEKAQAGSGYRAVIAHCTTAAKQDLGKLLAMDPEDDPPPGRTRETWLDALRFGIAFDCSSEGELGVQEIRSAVSLLAPQSQLLDVDEELSGLGERVAYHVILANHALRRLMHLFDHGG